MSPGVRDMSSSPAAPIDGFGPTSPRSLRLKSGRRTTGNDERGPGEMGPLSPRRGGSVFTYLVLLGLFVLALLAIFGALGYTLYLLMEWDSTVDIPGGAWFNGVIRSREERDL